MINKIIHKHHHKISIIFHTFFYIFTYYNDFTNINDYMMFTKTTLSSSFQKCFQKVKRLFKKKKKYNICQLCKIRLCVLQNTVHTICTHRTHNVYSLYFKSKYIKLNLNSKFHIAVQINAHMA